MDAAWERTRGISQPVFSGSEGLGDDWKEKVKAFHTLPVNQQSKQTTRGLLGVNVKRSSCAEICPTIDLNRIGREEDETFE
jgi:hypothetical protein